MVPRLGQVDEGRRQGLSLKESDQERVLAPQRRPEDDDAEPGLRPRTLDEYVGQEAIKENLRVFMQAARQRGEPLDHVLLHGPPGLGKTTLAAIIAHAMQRSLHMTSGPAIERPGDVAAILTSLQPGDVLFIDEIHRLPRVVEEILYPAMEDFRLDIVIGKGPGARSVRLDIPPFTLVGATTRAGSLTSPLRDRFGVVFRLDYYRPAELQEIVTRSARLLDVDIDAQGAAEIARRSRGTPRIANRLLRRVRDFAQVRAGGRITLAVAREALTSMAVDEMGLDSLDRRLLGTILDQFGGGPVGVETLAAAVGEEAETIEDVYEPFLLQIGFLARTPRGRMVTAAACQHLGRPFPSRRPGPGSAGAGQPVRRGEVPGEQVLF